MKLMYLDIDGVLNSDRSVIAYVGKQSNSVFEHNKNIIDPVSVALIEKLLLRFDDLSIVITSTHRVNFIHALNPVFETAKYMNGLTNSLEIAHRIVGLTDSKSGSRGEQIKRSVELLQPDNYVIVDDINSMLPEQQKHFVHCDSQMGFSAQNYRDVTKILGDEDVALVYL